MDPFRIVNITWFFFGVLQDGMLIYLSTWRSSLSFCGNRSWTGCYDVCIAGYVWFCASFVFDSALRVASSAGSGGIYVCVCGDLFVCVSVWFVSTSSWHDTQVFRVWTRFCGIFDRSGHRSCLCIVLRDAIGVWCGTEVDVWWISTFL